MAQIVITCPFCHAQDMAMKIFGIVHTNRPTRENHELIRNEQDHSVYVYTHTALGAAICMHCYKPVGLSLKWQSASWKQEDDKIFPALLEDNSETPYSLGVEYSVAIPPPQNTELKYLPVEVQKAFTQAEKNMTMENCEEPAVIMYRRALEIAIGTQYPHITGKNLKEKIDGLEAQHIIPATMKDWAHEIRSIGNDGAHGLSGVTRADAEAAQAFAAAFLQYCLSLPEEIRQRRAQTNAAGKRTAAADEPVPAEGADFVKA